MRMMPGRQYGEGAKQLAALFAVVLLAVFFALAIRTEWDRRHGVAVPEWSQVLQRRMGRNPLAPHRAQQAQALRRGDVI